MWVSNGLNFALCWKFLLVFSTFSIKEFSIYWSFYQKIQNIFIEYRKANNKSWHRTPYQNRSYKNNSCQRTTHTWRQLIHENQSYLRTNHIRGQCIPKNNSYQTTYHFLYFDMSWPLVWVVFEKGVLDELFWNALYSTQFDEHYPPCGY